MDRQGTHVASAKPLVNLRVPLYSFNLSSILQRCGYSGVLKIVDNILNTKILRDKILHGFLALLRAFPVHVFPFLTIFQ